MSLRIKDMEQQYAYLGTFGHYKTLQRENIACPTCTIKHCNVLLVLQNSLMGCLRCSQCKLHYAHENTFFFKHYQNSMYCTCENGYFSAQTFWSHTLSNIFYINETYPASVVARGPYNFALLHTRMFVQYISRLAIYFLYV